jgi:Glyoxalase/Bleomycin resistance protein/Dioxygenase superfamily
MSALFGKVSQNGYVVRDIAAAMKFWTEVLRVGPFFYIPAVKSDWFRYRGTDSAVEMSIALANSGDLQIELIQQRNDAPSMYLDFLREHGEGLQHIPTGAPTTRRSTTARSRLVLSSVMKARSAGRRDALPISRRRAMPAR